MKAVVWHGPRMMEVETVEPPEPNVGEVLLSVGAVGICGSELSGYLGENSLRIPPLVMGHEFSGTVVGVGHGVSRLGPGDRVVVNPLVTCKVCPLCRRGLENLCVKRTLVGVHRPGAFAELVTVPEQACYVLPPDFTDVQGSLVEPLACSLRAIRLATVGVESSIIIFGAGTIGLFALRAARVAGVGRAAVVDTNPNRLRIAETWGADIVINPRETDPVETVKAMSEGLGVDCGIDAVGLPITRRQLTQAVRPGGTAVLIGLHENETALPCNDIVRREVQITGSFCYTWHDFRSAISLLQSGKIVPDRSWLEERGLEDAKRSFDELIDSPSPVTKIVLRV